MDFAMRALICRLPFMSAVRPGRAASVLAKFGCGAAPVAAQVRDSEIDELRGAAMRRMFPKLHSWRATRRERRAALEAHAYLSAARSQADLEQRIRAVERCRRLVA
jgi:hypothetical protein